MKVRLITVGQKMPAWVNEAFTEYSRRLPREIELELHELALAQRGRKPDTARIKQNEGKALMEKSRDCYRVALHETGTQWSSPELAKQLDQWMHGGRDVALLVGGPDGHAADTLQQSDALWSLSRLTLPHGMVRPIVSEQLYRAWSILSNHPYHRT